MTERLENELCSLSLSLSLSHSCYYDVDGIGATTSFISVKETMVACSTAELILQPFRHFTYVTAHSITLPSLYLRRRSFSNSSVALPTSQFILQPFFRLYVISRAHTPIFPYFTYVTTHSPTLPSLYLHHSSFSNPSVASLLQPFFRFSYVEGSSLTSPGEPLMM